MKSGEVAVENLAAAFRELKTKDPAVMPSYATSQHYQPPPTPLPTYQPGLHTPYQHHLQPLAATYAYSTGAILPAGKHQSTKNDAVGKDGRGRSGFTSPHPHIAVHGGTKRNIRSTQPPLPVSPPSRSGFHQPPSSLQLPRSKSAKQMCTRFFTQGSCTYGSTCKFSHISTSGVGPASGPPRMHYQPTSRVTPAPTPPSIDEKSGATSLDESDFPSLSKDNSVAEAHPSGLRRPINSPTQSNKLVFRDAVLQNQRKSSRTEVKPPRWLSPSKSSTSSEPDVSDHSGDESTMASNQSPVKAYNSYRATYENRPSMVEEARREAYTGEQAVARRASGGYSRGDHSSRQVSIKPVPIRTSARIVEPAIGLVGYPMYSVYLPSNNITTDDSSAFSVLSRDAHEFVIRVDSKLRQISAVQHQAIANLEAVAKTLSSDAVIEVYGSNFTRLALPQSDIDCVLSSPCLESKLPADILRALSSRLQNHGCFRRVEVLDNAKIPVLKIVFCSSPESTTEVMLDLTCGHSPGHSGLSARNLIYSYQVEMPALRPLVFILKSHLQRRGLNSAFTGGLSSYGLVLLVVRFLQACGDNHCLQELVSDVHLKNAHGRPVITQSRTVDVPRLPPVYEFTRNGRLTWRTGLGNLLLLFLETYVTFDYRRFGIKTENAGEYFLLPSDKVSLDPSAVISPYIVDPIKKTRSIGHCFRMHEVVQAWYELYQLLIGGMSVEDAINHPPQPNPV